jgi:hypothetical protein
MCYLQPGHSYVYQFAITRTLEPESSQRNRQFAAGSAGASIETKARFPFAVEHVVICVPGQTLPDHRLWRSQIARLCVPDLFRSGEFCRLSVSPERHSFCRSLLPGGAQDFDVDEVPAPEEQWGNDVIGAAEVRLRKAGTQSATRDFGRTHTGNVERPSGSVRRTRGWQPASFIHS